MGQAEPVFVVDHAAQGQQVEVDFAVGPPFLDGLAAHEELDAAEDLQQVLRSLAAGEVGHLVEVGGLPFGEGLCFVDGAEGEVGGEELAETVGVSRNTISSIETGQFNPTAKLALILCIALDRKFEELFYFDE